MPAPSVKNEYPIEVTAPDISAYSAGTGGIPYAMTFDSGIAGPHVMVSAVVHGNEPCGAIALDWLLQRDVRPQRGKLTLAFVNIAAYESFDPADPTMSRWVDQDMNRVWSHEVLNGAGNSVELRRARELRPLIGEVDLLFDIHSMQNASEALILSGALPKGRSLAKQVGIPALVVSDHGHAEGVRMRDYGGFSDHSSSRNALLVECGQHWAAEAAEVAKASTVSFLRATGVVSDDFGEDIGREKPPQQVFVEVTEAVTVETDDFVFADHFIGGEILQRQGTLIGMDGGRPIVSPYDNCFLVMPSKRLLKGKTAVRLGRVVDPATVL